jgi:hypothetical protein
MDGQLDTTPTRLRTATPSGGNSLFPVGGANPSKFPTKPSNFQQTPPFVLEKVVFSPLIGQNFRKFVIFHEGGGGGGGRPTEISATGYAPATSAYLANNFQRIFMQDCSAQYWKHG